MTTQVWDELPDGRQVHAHTLEEGELRLTVLEWGATAQSLRVGDREVVVGLPDLAAYLSSDAYLGATIGRYANRIAGGRFSVDGVAHSVPRNDRGNNLHGGPEGFDRQLWATRAATPTYVELGLVSPDGHQGFPGRVEVAVRFTLEAGEVRIDYRARTGAPTPLALTNHSYFRLAGTSIEDHELTVPASAYTPVDETGIPTGAVEPVAGTAYDLRTPARLGDRVSDPRLDGGLDHNYVVDGSGMRTVAVLAADGLALTVASDQPGLQVYTGNKLRGAHARWSGVALETQAFPDSPNQPAFPDVVLRPGQEWRSTTTWRFSG